MRKLPLVLGLGLVAALPAHATLIQGEAVRLNGTVVDTNPIEFYIPLSREESGIFGYGGAGQSSDSCSTSWSSPLPDCGGGWLGMALRFDPIPAAGTYELELKFTDLDLIGVNDPWYFTESLVILGDSILATIFSEGDDLVYSANHYTQTVRSDVYVDSTKPYYIALVFGSHIATKGSFTNTLERLTATMRPVSVPEPGTLSLLGAGLVTVGLIGRRRRKNAASR